MDSQTFADDFVVEPSHLNRLQTDVQALRGRLVADYLRAGIAHGLELTETSPLGMHLELGTGVAYSASGRRMEVATPEEVDLTTTYLNGSTAPAAAQERYVAIYLHPARVESEPWTDTNGDKQNLRALESYEVRVVAGASASTGLAVVPAAPDADDVLVGRVLRTSAMTSVRTTDVRVLDVARATRAEDVYAESVERALEVAPTDPPSLSVVVAGGDVVINGVRLSIATTTVPAFTPPASSGQSRIDLIGVSTGGVVTVRAGTEFATAGLPVYPSTRGLLPIAFVGLDEGQTKIAGAHLADARPFLAATVPFARTHRVALSAAQTAVTLPWGYAQGLAALQVFLDGVRLDTTEFSETSPTEITLTTPAGGGEILFVYALDVQDPVAPLPLAQVADDLSGILLWRGCYTEVRSGHQSVVIPPMQACVIGNVRRYTTLESVVTADALSGSTRYYLYAYASGATGLAFELSTTAPTTDALWKTGAVGTHRYLAYVPTTSGGTAYNFRRESGGYQVWRHSEAITAAAMRLALGSTSGAWSTTTWGVAVPPSARLVRALVAANSDSGGGVVAVRAPGGDSDGFAMTVSGEQFFSETVEVETNALGQVAVRLDGTIACDALVLGFWE